MSAVPSADDYPHRTVLLGPNRDAMVLVAFVEAAAPDAELDASMREAFELQAHLVLAARTAEGLENAQTAALRLAQHTPAATRH